MTRRRLAVCAALALAAGCGPTAVAAPAREPITMRSAARDVAGVDVGGDFATIEIVQPDEGGVHRCMFLLRDGRFDGFDCYDVAQSRFMPLGAEQAARADALLAEVDDWPIPVDPDAESTRPVTLTIRDGRAGVARFGVTVAQEPTRMHAFRVAAMSAAQDGLGALRALAESCGGCRDGEYCEVGMMCSTLGPRGKNCAPAPSCHRRLPATSRCQHDYECASRRCEGVAVVSGACL